MVEDVMDGDTPLTPKTRLIVSGLVLKNEMYSVCFFSYSTPLVHASVNSRRRCDFFLFTTFLKQYA
jgi:hypothetical protein